MLFRSKGSTPTVFAQSNHVHPLQTSVSGNAGTATKLATSRKIGSVDFDGSADIDLGQILAIPGIKVQLPSLISGNWTFPVAYSTWVFVFWTTDNYWGSPSNGMSSCWNPYGTVFNKGATLSACSAPTEPPAQWKAFAIGV